MLNFLTGDRSLRRVRDRGRQFAQELYDPNVFAPQREMASRQATMGIDQGGIRSGALAQLSRIDNDADIFGGSAGRMVGMMGQQNLAQGRNITDMETRLGIADQQARLQGQQQLAEVQSRQLQTGAMRDAAMTEADMMYQAERSSRRQALAGTAIGLGTMGAMGMFPGLKDGALALINKLTGATGLPEGAAMSADVEPTSTGGFTGVSALDIINSTNMSQFGQTPDVEPTTPNSLDGMSFGQAFRTSRDQGLDRFTWRGRPFTTEMADTQTPATPTIPQAPELERIALGGMDEPTFADPEIDVDFDYTPPDALPVSQPIGFQPSRLEVLQGPMRAWTNDPEVMRRRGGSFMMDIDNQAWDQAVRRQDIVNPQSPMGQLMRDPEFQQARLNVDAVRTLKPNEVESISRDFLDAIRQQPEFLRSMNRQTRELFLQRFPEFQELYQQVRLF
jgi:hypothetical protein